MGMNLLLTVLSKLPREAWKYLLAGAVGYLVCYVVAVRPPWRKPDVHHGQVTVITEAVHHWDTVTVARYDTVTVERVRGDTVEIVHTVTPDVEYEDSLIWVYVQGGSVEYVLKPRPLVLDWVLEGDRLYIRPKGSQEVTVAFPRVKHGSLSVLQYPDATALVGTWGAFAASVKKRWGTTLGNGWSLGLGLCLRL